MSHKQPSRDSYNPNTYPDPNLLRWVFSREIFPETFARFISFITRVLLWNFKKVDNNCDILRQAFQNNLSKLPN